MAATSVDINESAREEQIRLKNESKNRRLQEEGSRMRDKIHIILNRHNDKINETIQGQEDMTRHKGQVFEQVEQFFELVKKKVN